MFYREIHYHLKMIDVLKRRVTFQERTIGFNVLNDMGEAILYHIFLVISTSYSQYNYIIIENSYRERQVKQTNT